jgi:hypothetical protein
MDSAVDSRVVRELGDGLGRAKRFPEFAVRSRAEIFTGIKSVEWSPRIVHGIMIVGVVLIEL